MADRLSPREFLWKRPTNVSFPQIWYRFETRVKNGRSFRVRIQEIEENRFEEILNFMDANYNNAELSSKALNLSRDELSVRETRNCRRRILEQKISLMAVVDEYASIPKLLGCFLIYVESQKDIPLAYGCRGEFRKIISDRDEYLYKKANPFDIFQCDIILSDMGLNVAPEFQGYGIGYKMLSCLPTLTKCFDIPAIMMSITNPNVQKFAETIGYKTYAEFKYSEQKHADGKLIIPVEDTPSCKFMGMKF